MQHAALGRVAVAAMIGTAAGIAAGALGPFTIAPLIGWDVAALVYLGAVWAVVGRMDAPTTAAHATREDPSRASADGLLLVAAVASLAAVGLVMIRASHLSGAGRVAEALLATASVVVSWFVVHTTYMLRYARLWHLGPDGGIDFNEKNPPRYADFAYLAFTIGMTFQVSDTPLSDSRIRANALRHALLSYLYGTVIIASAINVVAGLNR